MRGTHPQSSQIRASVSSLIMVRADQTPGDRTFDDTDHARCKHQVGKGTVSSCLPRQRYCFAIRLVNPTAAEATEVVADSTDATVACLLPRLTYARLSGNRMDTTRCFRTERGRSAWHGTTAHQRRYFAALSVIFANLFAVGAGAKDLLLGNYVRLPPPSQVVTAESEPTSNEPSACLSCVRVGQHRDGCEAGEPGHSLISGLPTAIRSSRSVGGSSWDTTISRTACSTRFRIGWISTSRGCLPRRQRIPASGIGTGGSAPTSSTASTLRTLRRLATIQERGTS